MQFSCFEFNWRLLVLWEGKQAPLMYLTSDNSKRIDEKSKEKKRTEFNQVPWFCWQTRLVTPIFQVSLAKYYSFYSNIHATATEQTLLWYTRSADKIITGTVPFPIKSPTSSPNCHILQRHFSSTLNCPVFALFMFQSSRLLSFCVHKLLLVLFSSFQERVQWEFLPESFLFSVSRGLICFQ